MVKFKKLQGTWNESYQNPPVKSGELGIPEASFLWHQGKLNDKD
jgi:hypothetical protein